MAGQIRVSWARSLMRLEEEDLELVRQMEAAYVQRNRGGGRDQGQVLVLAQLLRCRASHAETDKVR